MRLLVCLALGVGTSLAAAGPRSVDDLTGPWQLFVDDDLIVIKSNVVRTYHPFEKYAGNPVLVANTAWEQLLNIYGTVLPDESGNGYRMWYQNYLTNDPCGATSRQLYATSTNGIHWVKPPLYQHAWCGSFSNNLYYGGFMTSVMHTPDDPDPARRYKLMTFSNGVWTAAWSSNGIRFFGSTNRVAGGSDSGNFCWDPRARVYRSFVKNSWTDANGLRRRAVASAVTTNFTNWPPETLILWPDAVDDRWSSNIIQRTHFYGLAAFPYETMYLGFLWIHRATNLVGNPTNVAGYQIGPIFAELVSSRDGLHWTREEGDRPPILPLGPPGSWDGGMVFTARAPVVEGDTIKLWYGGFINHHDTPLSRQRGAIGLATLRKDGFASLNAGAATGIVITRPFAHTGGPLLVNYRTNAPGGWLKVEVLDALYRALPGYTEAECAPLTGNSITQTVTWTAHSQLPTNQPYLRFRFILQNAAIYSFMAGSNAVVVDVPPTLNWARTGSNLLLSWPTNHVGFILEQADTLPAATWTNAPAPALVGDQYIVTNTLEATQRFYRLRKP